MAEVINYKNQLISYFGRQKKCVKFRSNKTSGPSNAPVWYSWIEVNKQRIFANTSSGSKIYSEQELAKRYLNCIKEEMRKSPPDNNNESLANSVGQPNDDDDDNYIEEADLHNGELLNSLRKEEESIEANEINKRIQTLEERILALEKNNSEISLCLKTNAENLNYVLNRLMQIEMKLETKINK